MTDLVENSYIDTKRRGNIYVISGPSGVGKGTLLSILLEKHPDISLSTSATTRNPRPGEINGINYFFMTKETFQKMIDEDKFLEWTEYSGNYYGTFISTVKDMINEGIDIVLEIDVNGALNVKRHLKEAVLILLLPPSLGELRKRLFKRKSESEEEIQRRLSIVKNELDKKSEFNYAIVNNDLSQAYTYLESIVLAERCRVRV